MFASEVCVFALASNGSHVDQACLPNDVVFVRRPNYQDRGAGWPEDQYPFYKQRDIRGKNVLVLTRTGDQPAAWTLLSINE